jgi:hypothetical protein
MQYKKKPKSDPTKNLQNPIRSDNKKKKSDPSELLSESDRIGLDSDRIRTPLIET